ncbi:MAG: PAS domain-containing protein [Anaerolineales bacterium]|nr:PAS domain-containing protein [Anaerolineales bacterium]
MKSFLRNWLTPPLFNNDETKTRQAFILHYILLTALIAPVCYSAVIYFQSPEQIERALAQSIVSEFIASLIFILTRKGYLRTAAIFLVGFFWLLFTVMAFARFGVRGTGFILGHATVIVIAGALLGGKGSLAISLLTILTGGWFAYLESSGQRFVGVAPNPSQTVWLTSSIFYLIINVVQFLSAWTARETFKRAPTNEVQYRALLENIPVITYIIGLGNEPVIRYVSPQIEELLGYSRDDFMKDPGLWKKLLHPEDRERTLSESEATDQSDTTFDMEYRFLTQDGNTVWIRDKAKLITADDGAATHWLGAWMDITEQKQSDEQQASLISALTRRAIQLQTAAEVSHAASSTLDLEPLLATVVELIRSHFNYYYIGIFLLNEPGTHALLKAATGEAGRMLIAEEQKLDVGESSMVGWCLTHRKARIALDVGEDAVHFKNPRLPLTRSEIALPLISRDAIIGAMTIQSELASAFSNADVTALQTMADQIANAIANAQLFTERTQLINELEGRNAELERFTYTVSHDLKSPLVTIRGFLGFIREDAKKRDMKQFDADLSKIANAADRMQALLNDLLELSRVGRITNPPRDLPFEQIVQEARDLLAGSFHQSDIQVAVKDNLPVVRGDRIRLVEVMQNLLSNAIKFMGAQAEPRIEIGCTGQDSNGMATLFVRDNGIGIEPQFHEKVFGLFNRLNPNIEGTGVGLTLVRRIVEVHGGKVWVESRPSAGSAFYFTLPVSASASAEAAN